MFFRFFSIFISSGSLGFLKLFLCSNLWLEKIVLKVWEEYTRYRFSFNKKYGSFFRKLYLNY